MYTYEFYYDSLFCEKQAEIKHIKKQGVKFFNRDKLEKQFYKELRFFFIKDNYKFTKPFRNKKTVAYLTKLKSFNDVNVCQSFKLDDEFNFVDDNPFFSFTVPLWRYNEELRSLTVYTFDFNNNAIKNNRSFVERNDLCSLLFGLREKLNLDIHEITAYCLPVFKQTDLPIVYLSTKNKQDVDFLKRRFFRIIKVITKLDYIKIYKASPSKPNCSICPLAYLDICDSGIKKYFDLGNLSLEQEI